MILTVLFLVFISSGASFAHDNKLESWYTYWGLGYVNNTYPSGLQFLFDRLKEENKLADHSTLGSDLLGLYWPRGERTLIGGIINGSSDSYILTVDNLNYELDLYNLLYSLSIIHFLNDKIGQGPFLRTDAGIARHVVQIKDVTNGDREGKSKTSETGTGFLIGVGYGVPVTSGTRVLISVNLSQRYVEGDQIKTSAFMLNGLF